MPLPRSLLLALATAVPCTAQESFAELAKAHIPVPPPAALQATLGDLDGDGDLDVIRQGLVYENDGHARFRLRGYLVGFLPFTAVVAADVDGDGDEDVVASDSNGSRVLLSDGRFGFAADPRGAFSASWMTLLASADLDGDGRDDLLGVDLTSSLLQLFLADPVRGLTPAPFPSVSSPVITPRHLQLFDVDGDADIDVLSGLTLVRNQGGGTFVVDAAGVTTVIGAPVLMSNPADADGDGAPDLFVTDGSRHDLLWNRGGNLVGRGWYPVEGPREPGAAVALCDADGDGVAELIWGRPPAMLTGLLFMRLVGGALPGDAQIDRPQVADLDGDGFADLLGATREFWLADGRGGFRSAWLTGPRGAGDVAGRELLADLDGDGDVDHLGLDPDGSGVVLMNDGDGGFAATPPGATPPYRAAPFGLRGGDVDGDGDCDLLVLGYEPAGGRVALWINDGRGRFVDATARLPATAAETRGGHLFDLDRDGDLDLLLLRLDPAATPLVWFELLDGDGRGGFAAPRTLFPAGGGAMLAPGDLDGDGDLDLVYADDTELAVHFRDAAGGYATRRRIKRPIATVDLATADVDGDGDLDILQGWSTRLLLYLNDGLGQFTDVTGFRVPPTVQTLRGHLALGDVDEDGDVDVIVGAILLENQAGTFVRTGRVPRLLAGSDLYPDGRPTALVDLDGDGDLDLAGYGGHFLMNLHRHVHAPYLARPGRPFTWRVSCQPGYLGSPATAVGVLGFGPAQLPLGDLGTLRVDPALTTGVLTVPPDPGLLDVEIDLPNDPRALGIALHAQFVVIAPGGAPRLTNAVADTVR
jgi:hypothetical protein